MHQLRHPRCCEVIGLGGAGRRRFVLQVGAARPEVSVELAAAAVERLGAGIDELVGRLGSPRDVGLGLPPRPVTLAVEVLALSLEGDDVLVEGWVAGTAAPALRLVLGEDVARLLAASCRNALAGRPPLCPFCGLVLEATGHVCPRANGYRR